MDVKDTPKEKALRGGKFFLFTILTLILVTAGGLLIAALANTDIEPAIPGLVSLAVVLIGITILRTRIFP